MPKEVVFVFRFCCLATVLCCMVFLYPALSAAEQVNTDILEISKYGNIVLSMKGSEFLSKGYDYGDIVTVRFEESAAFGTVLVGKVKSRTHRSVGDKFVILTFGTVIVRR